MGKSNTGTKHHCVGGHTWIGDISPGGCRKVTRISLLYCDKHWMPCHNGCEEWHHLKNQEGCMGCQSQWMADARRARLEAARNKDAALQDEDSAFWRQGKERRRERRSKQVLKRRNAVKHDQLTCVISTRKYFVVNPPFVHPFSSVAGPPPNIHNDVCLLDEGRVSGLPWPIMRHLNVEVSQYLGNDLVNLGIRNLQSAISDCLTVVTITSTCTYILS